MAWSPADRPALPAISARTVAAVLRCGSCRFAALYFLPFYAGLLHAGSGGIGWAAFGAVFWFCFSLATELTNRLSDRVEDELNRPERTALCHAVGYGRLRVLAIGLWAAVVVLDVAALVVAPSIVLGVLLALATAASVNYSFGPRVKRRSWLAPFVITFPVAGTFLTGWAVGGEHVEAIGAGEDLLRSAGPFAVALGGFTFTLAGVKDLTDVAGDREIRFEGAWVRLLRLNLPEVTAALAYAPFVFVLAMVAVDVLSYRLLALTAFLPVVVAIAIGMRLAVDARARAAVRELVYQYWFAVIATALVLYVPSRELVLAAVGAAAYWTLTSRYLHWSNGMRMVNVKALLAAAGIGRRHEEE